MIAREMVLLLGIGIVAGILTTLAGQGGGLVLLLALAASMGPHAALAASTPALLFGNMHRAWLYRKSADRSLAWRALLGIVPGALVGGVLAARLPGIVLQACMVGLTVLALLRQFVRPHWMLPRWALVPVGVLVGVAAGGAGGAGVLVAPMFLASGLSGVNLVGTIAITAVALHAARVVSYGATGLFSADTARVALMLIPMIWVGNHLGDGIRRFLNESWERRIEYGTLVVCVLLSLAGIG